MAALGCSWILSFGLIHVDRILWSSHLQIKTPLSHVSLIIVAILVKLINIWLSIFFTDCNVYVCIFLCQYFGKQLWTAKYPKIYLTHAQSCLDE